MTTIEPRASWGARAPKSPPSPWPAGSPRGLVVHWVGGGAMHLETKDHSACQIAARGVQAYEMSKKYSDIAYNLLACPHGRLMEARGINVANAANGPATNRIYGAVCALVGQGDPLTPQLLAVLTETRTIYPGDFKAHRDVNTTSCPGDELAAWVHAPPPAPPMEDDMEHGQAVHSVCAAGDRVITLERWGGMPNSWGATFEGGGYWPGKDVARKVVLRGPLTDGGPSCITHASVPVSGWVLDLNGAMHSFREKGANVPMPPARTVAYWKGGQILAFNEIG